MERKATSGIMLTLLLIGMLTLSFNVNAVNAYKSGSGGTHQFIFEQARTILRNDGYVSYADFLDSVDPADPGRTYLQVMIAGSDDHDDIISARDHYHDPMGHNGLYYFFTYWKSAAQFCQELFDVAVSKWSSGDYHNAIYTLGWATHMVQDVCVPHHAMTSAADWHSEYESWVDDNKYSFAVYEGGIYSFCSLRDYQYYIPEHYLWDNVSAYDWVDYNAHESDRYSLSANGKSLTYVEDYDPGNTGLPYIETVHYLPNNLETIFTVTKYQTDRMRLYYEKIDMEHGYDYIRIYDKYDNLLDVYTGSHANNWTSWYYCGGTLKIKITTDSFVPSWGYKFTKIESYDTGEDLYGATSVLLPRAQRISAGFIKFFLDKVLNPIYIRSNGSVEPSTAPIQRNGNFYTFKSNIDKPITVEKDNVIINGNEHTLQASFHFSDGLHLSGRTNVTIQNVSITGFWSGIFIWNSTNITLNHNTLITCWDALRVYHFSQSTITSNNLTNNDMGIYLSGSFNNAIYHNVFLNNTVQVYSYSSTNSWDNGYPSGGNYWSDYLGVDRYWGPYQNETGSDGIGDTPYVIDANNRDRYPSMSPYKTRISVVNPTTMDNNFIFYTNITSIGTRFNATLWITDVSDLYGYQVYLTINDTMLNITGAWLPTWDSEWVFYNKTFYGMGPAFHDENVNGYIEAILIGGGLLGTQPSFFGSGRLAVIELEIFQRPPTGGKLSALLNIINIGKLWETKLCDSKAHRITSTKINGYYEYNLVHDIAVTSLRLSKTVVGQGYTVSINITTENHGDYAETFNVTTYANANMIAISAITLTSGSSTTITFTWNTSGFAKGNYTISATATQVPDETDTTDNIYTIPNVYVAMVGDLSGPKGVPDGIVDIDDVMPIALAFGSQKGPDGKYWHSPPCKNCPHSPNCDINDDGIIDIDDVIIPALNYGKTDP